jgi:hypothetical protein
MLIYKSGFSTEKKNNESLFSLKPRYTREPNVITLTPDTTFFADKKIEVFINEGIYGCRLLITNEDGMLDILRDWWPSRFPSYGLEVALVGEEAFNLMVTLQKCWPEIVEHIS